MSKGVSNEVMKRMGVLKINRERDLYKKIQEKLRAKDEKGVMEFITQFSPRWRDRVSDFVNNWVNFILQETCYGDMFWLFENLVKLEGIDPNVKDTPTHVAAMYNKMKWLTLLLQLPTLDVNEQDLVGKTPLHWAMLKGYLEVIQILIQHDADENVLDCNNRSCLDVAKESSVRDYALEALEQRQKKREALEKRKKLREQSQKKNEK